MGGGGGGTDTLNTPEHNCYINWSDLYTMHLGLGVFLMQYPRFDKICIDIDCWCLSCLSRLFSLLQHRPPVFFTILSMIDSMRMKMTETG